MGARFGVLGLPGPSVLGPTPRPDIEAEAVRGIKGTKWYRDFPANYGEEANLNPQDYNLILGWIKGARPMPDPYDKGREHWPDAAPDGTMLKTASHPTIWMEYFMRTDPQGRNPQSIGINTYDDARRHFGRDFVPGPVLNAINARRGR